MKVKSFITLDVESSLSGILENIKKEILQTIINGHDLEFVDSLHVTLDCQGLIELREAVLRYEKLIIKRGHFTEIDKIKISNFNNFVSNTNGKRIIFLELEGGEGFFDCIRSIGCSINIPHITLLEMNNEFTDKEMGEIIQNLNENINLQNYLKELVINNNILFLKIKTQDRILKTVGRLRLRQTT